MRIKKALIIGLAFVFAFALAACGDKTGSGGSSGGKPGDATTPPATSSSGGISSAPSDSPTGGGDNGSGELTASIEPANGWEKIDSVAADLMYTCSDTGAAPESKIYLTVAQNLLGKSENDFIEGRKESDAQVNKHLNPVFSDVTSVTVGGFDAKEYTMETDTGQLCRKIFIYRDKTVYCIQCDAYAEYLDVVKDDFQTMLDSFTLK